MTSLVASVCALVVLVAVACADGDSPASSKSDPGRSTATDGATEEVIGVPLAEPAPGLGRQCRSAARSLGFAVPCPTRLPLVAGEPVDCSGDCIGLAGERGEEVRGFFLNVEGYDANAGAPETVRHLIVEAQKARDAPPSPCFEGSRRGRWRRTAKKSPCWNARQIRRKRGPISVTVRAPTSSTFSPTGIATGSVTS
jgi:hypothetical protein